MFKNLMSFWRGKDFLTQVLEGFERMLNDTHRMFNSVSNKLLTGESVPGLKKELYGLDKKVNALERDIRKKVVEHLSIQASVDVSVCLVLMSVVKDAERLGDYAKNFFEVTEFMKGPFDRKLFKELFNDIDKELDIMFGKAKEAFKNSDENAAYQIMDIERGIVKRCDSAIDKLVSMEDMSTNTAVSFALMARYLKRTAAHLANIASSVILPVTDLDFFDEKHRRDK